jgi:hypothetical protein
VFFRSKRITVNPPRAHCGNNSLKHKFAAESNHNSLSSAHWKMPCVRNVRRDTIPQRHRAVVLARVDQERNPAAVALATPVPLEPEAAVVLAMLVQLEPEATVVEQTTTVVQVPVSTRAQGHQRLLPRHKKFAVAELDQPELQDQQEKQERPVTMDNQEHLVRTDPTLNQTPFPSQKTSALIAHLDQQDPPETPDQRDQVVMPERQEKPVQQVTQVLKDPLDLQGQPEITEHRERRVKTARQELPRKYPDRTDLQDQQELLDPQARLEAPETAAKKDQLAHQDPKVMPDQQAHLARVVKTASKDRKVTREERVHAITVLHHAQPPDIKKKRTAHQKTTAILFKSFRTIINGSFSNKFV